MLEVNKTRESATYVNTCLPNSFGSENLGDDDDAGAINDLHVA
jgi:hypothetical protein